MSLNNHCILSIMETYSSFFISNTKFLLHNIIQIIPLLYNPVVINYTDNSLIYLLILFVVLDVSDCNNFSHHLVISLLRY